MNSQAEPLDSAALRRLMSHWTTGVSVVTAEAADGPRGATASAVLSLSLDPLLVLACLYRESRTLRAMRESGRFAINVLTREQGVLAHRFASKEADKFAGVAWQPIEGAPVIDGVLAWLVCDVTDELFGGDHSAVLGAPLRGAAHHGEPLVVFRSRLRTLAAEG